MVNNRIEGFRGNPNIKRKGVRLDWSKDLIKEYQKCQKDIFYFIKNYYKIVTEDGITNMELYEYQKETISSMVDNRFTMMVQSRQSGKCVHINTTVKIRNKKTGQILETTVGELYETEKLKHM